MMIADVHTFHISMLTYMHTYKCELTTHHDNWLLDVYGNYSIVDFCVYGIVCIVWVLLLVP